MKITVLTENISCNSCLVAEHGLSLYIETENHKILFDMGQTSAFSHNADTLNIDLSDVDIAVLSHGHYDHGGGIRGFLELNSKALVYISPFAFEKHLNGSEKYIGLDKTLEECKRLVFVNDILEIDDEICIFSCNNKPLRYSIEPFGLNREINGRIVPESFPHEQYLIIKEKGKRVLFSGCSHKGVLNIQNWFKPNVFVGGFHLSKLAPSTTDCQKLLAVAEELLSYDTMYYTAHCTGIPQYEFLKSIMKDKLGYLSTGTVIEI